MWEDAKASLGHVITGVKWVVDQAGQATENQEDFAYLGSRFQSLQETLERIYLASTSSAHKFQYSSKALADLEGLIRDGVSLIEDYARASIFSGVMRFLQAGKYSERFLRIDKKLSAAVAGLTLDLSVITLESVAAAHQCSRPPATSSPPLSPSKTKPPPPPGPPPHRPAPPMTPPPSSSYPPPQVVVPTRPPPLPSVLLRVQEQAKKGQLGMLESIFRGFGAASCGDGGAGVGGPGGGGGEEDLLRLVASVGNGLLHPSPSVPPPVVTPPPRGRPGRAGCEPALREVLDGCGLEAHAGVLGAADVRVADLARMERGAAVAFLTSEMRLPSHHAVRLVDALPRPPPAPPAPSAPPPPASPKPAEPCTPPPPAAAAAAGSPASPKGVGGAESPTSPRVAAVGAAKRVVLPIRELNGPCATAAEGGCGHSGCMPPTATLLPHSSDSNGILLQVGQRILIARPAYLCSNAGCGQYFDKLVPGVCRYHPTTGGTKGKPLVCKKKCPTLDPPGCTVGEHAQPASLTDKR